MKTIILFILLTTQVYSESYLSAASQIKSLLGNERESAFEVAENIKRYEPHAIALLARNPDKQEKIFLSCAIYVYGIHIAKDIAFGVQFNDLARIEHSLCQHKARFKAVAEMNPENIFDNVEDSYKDLVLFLIKIYRSNEC